MLLVKQKRLWNSILNPHEALMHSKYFHDIMLEKIFEEIIFVVFDLQGRLYTFVLNDYAIGFFK